MIVLLIGLCISIMLFLLIQEGEQQKLDAINEEYPALAKDSAIMGIVSHYYAYTNSNPRGALLISLADGKKFTATVNAYPKEVVINPDNINHYVLINFLQTGDSIYKPAGKDSLFVIKHGEKYSFDYVSKERIDSIMGR